MHSEQKHKRASQLRANNNFFPMLNLYLFAKWGYGATVARLTPDQKVRSSNLSALKCCVVVRVRACMRAGVGE